jgi:hypothetical protein
MFDDAPKETDTEKTDVWEGNGRRGVRSNALQISGADTSKVNVAVTVLVLSDPDTTIPAPLGRSPEKTQFVKVTPVSPARPSVPSF